MGLITLYLGFRGAALHPRLYSAARVRGLGFDIRASCKKLGKDKLEQSIDCRWDSKSLLHLFFKDQKRRPRIKPSLRDEENIRAMRKDVGNDKNGSWGDFSRNAKM